jgi:hypothetical protein
MNETETEAKRLLDQPTDVPHVVESALKDIRINGVTATDENVAALVRLVAAQRKAILRIASDVDKLRAARGGR